MLEKSWFVTSSKKIFYLLFFLCLLPCTTFLIIAVTFPSWGPFFLEKKYDSMHVSAQGYHSLTALLSPNNIILDQLIITLANGYKLTAQDLSLSPGKLSFRRLDIHQSENFIFPTPTPEHTQHIKEPLKAQNIIIQFFNQVRAHIGSWFPRNMSFTLIISETYLSLSNLSLPVFKTHLQLMNLNLESDIYRAQIKAHMHQPKHNRRSSSPFSVTSEAALALSPDLHLMTSHVEGNLSFSPDTLLSLIAPLSKQAALPYISDKTQLTFPFQLDFEKKEEAWNLDAATSIQLSDIPDIPISDDITLAFPHSLTLNLHSHFQSRHLLPDFQLSWQKLPVALKHAAVTRPLTTKGAVSFFGKTGTIKGQISSHSKIEYLNIEADLNGTFLPDTPEDTFITAQWHFPHFKSFRGQNTARFPVQKGKHFLKIETTIPALSLEEIYSVSKTILPNDIPQELHSLSGKSSLHLTSSFHTSPMHQGHIKTLIQKVKIKKEKTATLDLKHLRSHITFFKNKEKLVIETPKDITLGSVILQTISQTSDQAPPQHFKNIKINGNIVQHAQRSAIFSLTKFNASWMNGKLSFLPQQFILGQEKYEITVEGHHLDLKQISQYWHVKGLDIKGSLTGKIPVIYYPDTNILRIGKGFLQTLQPGIIAYKPEDTSTTQKVLSQYGPLVGQALENFHFKVLKASLQRDQNDELLISVKLQGRNPNLLAGRPINFNLSLSGDLEKIVQQSLAILYFSQSFSERLRLDKIK